MKKTVMNNKVYKVKRVGDECMGTEMVNNRGRCK
jgi:hypothetical protein